MSDPDYKKMSLQDLIQLEGCYRPDTPQGSGPRAELEKRRFWTNFWTYGLVAWIALVLSVFSLILSVK